LHKKKTSKQVMQIRKTAAGLSIAMIRPGHEASNSADVMIRPTQKQTLIEGAARDPSRCGWRSETSSPWAPAPIGKSATTLRFARASRAGFCFLVPQGSPVPSIAALKSITGSKRYAARQKFATVLWQPINCNVIPESGAGGAPRLTRRQGPARNPPGKLLL